ncbi:tetratricopeptide repeat protein [Roseovarius sp. SCSIO 43702]|uniref:tetratricopeptide repeat protein n=1 Tax=Roseovarius sp. SCSIO 43702 TaxID=2823043 RepID=UPI001C72ECE1|nr:tetratricopeptide repeat protein [Roseovarius sp. SCSIO 43702]QYX58232.1 tetratricopeptide repeat protein [Roseovarius sp. SCSIO 43702]
MFSLPAPAEENARLDRLFQQLQQADEASAQSIAEEVALELSKSGSPAMDFLLRRGRSALEAGDLAAARDHFGALVDHAPEFAEGWHMRAVARARAGLLGPALSDLERALALEPRHFPALYSLGSLLEETGQDALAYEAYDAARAINPHDPDTLAALERLGHVTHGTPL